jgi:citrate synthase
MKGNLITARQAALRLGVKPQTVYAYVSRGLLTRTLAADGRTSRFSSAEIDGLARRGRPRKETQRVGAVEVSLVTGITALQSEQLAYRGYDVPALAASSSFEAVAELLWTGELPSMVTWPPAPAADHPARRASALLPPDSAAGLRFAVATAALACTEPLRFDLRPSAVLAHGRLLLTTLVEALPPLAKGRGAVATGQGVAARMWPRLSSLPPSRTHTRLLDAALVLLADHELATSTLAARVAASTRADPYAVVLAGLGAVSGALHGGAAMRVQQLLRSAESAASPEVAVGLALRGGSLPGFGHPVYRAEDPRAHYLLARLLPLIKPKHKLLIERVQRAATASASAPAANIDFALGALAHATDMALGATEAIFVLARTAGWIAHALEEYGEAPLRFRGRALYDGPAAGTRAVPG